MPVVLIKEIGDAKRKLAKVIRDYEANRITTEKFRSLVYGLSKYAELIYKTEIEIKIADLEDKTKNSFYE